MIIIPPPPLMYMAAENGGSTRSAGRKVLGVREDEFLIAYLGYVYSNKGVETLVEAFRSVSRGNTGVRLVMIGGNFTAANNSSSYAREIKRSLDNFTDRVIWTGPYDWDSQQASVYLRAADACVFPFADGVTLNRSSVAAAAAHGIPIVTTRGPIFEAPFLDFVNMLVCPPNDPQAMAAAIDSLIKRPDLRLRLRAGALQLAEQWFSWDKAIERMIEALSCQATKTSPNGRQSITSTLGV
jgi:glycosyltransferase involved in cell wall biosynthesis